IAALVVPYGPKGLAAAMARFGDWPVSIRAADRIPEGEREKLRGSGVSILWDPLRTASPEPGGRMLIAVLPVARDDEIAALMQKLPAVCSGFPSTALFMTGPPQDGHKACAAAALLGL
ncbi:MAG: hypothetical protein ACYCQK_10450, partial [Acidiferrobacteraceae bacterium]